MLNQDKIKIYYFQITDIWKLHCELHSELFDLTCDEYMHLLSSNLDELERTVSDKNHKIEQIRLNDLEREELLKKLSNDYPNQKIESISNIIEFFKDFAPEKESKHLFRFNELLIDIVTKIQDQNKKNQLFINKALSSLRQIREEATGKKSITTYNSKGMSSNRLMTNNP
ncbi:flagellar export chaperone FlgN [Bacteriovorax sp. Seq25_V]|uniref:flagellar export chaperone FlgN n=1 Tax=Bacteriovorax sp. Seq25_V TaxID=1201288 RepID=UPI000389DB4E|nr:flagellar export chaperone FlgN [Bacteriovorax sp. Seq25_V]EQC43565.1 FlgN protein [Bacteriovorax sp. Seq25_V]